MEQNVNKTNVTSENFRKDMQNISLPITPARANNNSTQESFNVSNIFNAFDEQMNMLNQAKKLLACNKLGLKAGNT